LNSHLRPTAAGVERGVVGTLNADGESSWIAIPTMDSLTRTHGNAHIFDVYKYRHFGFTAARSSTDRFALKSNNFTSMPCYFPGYEVPDTGLKGSGDFDTCMKVIVDHVKDERNNCRKLMEETKLEAQKKLGRQDDHQDDHMAHAIPDAPPEDHPDYQKWIEKLMELKEKHQAGLAVPEGQDVDRPEDQELLDHHREAEHRATECAPGIDARSRRALEQINRHEYYAGSEYLRVVNFISYWREKKGDGKLKGEMPTPSVNTLNASVQEFCKTSWDDIAQGDQPAGFNKSQAAGMCFEATYMLAKLLKFYGYRKTRNSSPFVTFVDSIAGQKIDWPLGAFLHLREHDQARDAKEQHKLKQSAQDREMRENDQWRKEDYAQHRKHQDHMWARASRGRNQEEL